MLHLEFEAHDKAEDMAFRMLEYRARLAWTYRLEVASAVFYLRHAGRGDKGHHQLGDSLTWSYNVFRLEEISSQELLASNRLPLIALMGLCKLEKPEDILIGLDRLRTEADNRKKRTLIGAFLSLISDKEVYQMVEQAIERDDFFLTLDTPFIRKIKQQANQEGREEGREEGRDETSRANILSILNLRFKLTERQKESLSQGLEALNDDVKLSSLVLKAVTAESLEAFNESLV
ncbi:MAG: hypothetical protein R2865_01005 [Deinococcales bacterium]